MKTRQCDNELRLRSYHIISRKSLVPWSLREFLTTYLAVMRDTTSFCQGIESDCRDSCHVCPALVYPRKYPFYSFNCFEWNRHSSVYVSCSISSPTWWVSRRRILTVSTGHKTREQRNRTQVPVTIQTKNGYCQSEQKVYLTFYSISNVFSLQVAWRAPTLCGSLTVDSWR